MLDWTTVGAVIAILASIAGLLKYVFYLLDKHKEHIDGRFKDHHNKLEKNATDIRINEKQIQQTRDEVHRDYVHKNDYKDDQRNMNEVVSDNFKALFKKMDAVARDLNQLIGSHNGKVNSNIEKSDNAD